MSFRLLDLSDGAALGEVCAWAPRYAIQCNLATSSAMAHLARSSLNARQELGGAPYVTDLAIINVALPVLCRIPPHQERSSHFCPWIDKQAVRIPYSAVTRSLVSSTCPRCSAQWRATTSITSRSLIEPRCGWSRWPSRSALSSSDKAAVVLA